MMGKILPVAAALAAARQSISAVRLAAVIGASERPLLALVLGASASGAPEKSGNVAAFAFERPDDYRVALDPAPLEVLDADYLGLAWVLGAWDVARTEHSPLPSGSDPLDPRYGIAHLLHDPYEIKWQGRAAERMPCPVDGRAWAEAAAAQGWITWLCKPLCYGPDIRSDWIGKDRTLRPDGGRDPRPWTAWEPVVRGTDHQSIIRLGRAPHGNRGKRDDSR